MRASNAIVHGLGLSLVVLFVLSFVFLNPFGSAAAQSVPASKFVVPIAEGADPWVIRDPHQLRYLWCMSEGNRAIAIHASDRLTSMGEQHIVWKAPDTGPFSREIWAPELHFLDRRWHIYFAASDGRNENHLAYVLKSKTDNPLGEYELHGPMATGEGDDGRSPNTWAIDMTVLQLHGRRYALWSGWDAPGTDRQFLYIAAMRSSVELAGKRVRLCANDDYLWERIQPDSSQRGLNEGPQVFQSGGRTCVVYSCGGSWLPTYKLGLLELVGKDPLDPNSWKKHARPVFHGTDRTYGLGHSCFVQSIDNKQWWHVFHAKRDRNPGWRRSVFVQSMSTNAGGLPVFGRPVMDGDILDRPSGEIVARAALPITLFSRSASETSWSYYGHHQFMHMTPGGLRLGRIPKAPVNDYRSGEKMLLDEWVPNDVTAKVTIDFRGDNSARDAGILFRCSGPSIGYDAQRGYFAGLIPGTGLIMLGKTDGRNWTEIARRASNIDASRPQTISVQMVGDRITVTHGDNVVEATDGTYSSGTVGLRVVDADAVFSDFRIGSQQ